MNLFKLAFLGSGRGSNFHIIQKNINDGKLLAKTSIVVSDKKSKILELAKNMNLDNIFIDTDLFSTREDYDKELVKVLKDKKVDLIILAGYMRILTPVFIKEFEGRILNIHPSLLPSFKGLHPQRQAIEAGVKISGCTVHYVTQALDSGPIIAQKAVEVFPDDSEYSLAERILEQEHAIYTLAIQSVLNELNNC
jgi:phosphoribosylglycinamide formyltransferase 1